MSIRILAAIVTYNPDLAAIEQQVASLQSQVEQILIVDNGSSNCEELRSSVTSDPDKCELIELGQNLGLGAAHNTAIQYARKAAYTHILILDQDSVPEADMVSQLSQAMDALAEQSHQVSAVGAVYSHHQSQGNEQQSFFVRFGALKFKRSYCGEDACSHIPCDFLISSGSLFALSVLDDVGDMDESLFIDHVDTEWFLRAKSKGYQAYGVCAARMQHALGEKTHRIKLLRERHVPQHKPFRYYYIFRNSLLLYKRGYCSLFWKWNDLQRLLQIAVMYGLFCPPRGTHLAMMAKGIWHGLIGKKGKLESV